jgi:hypothetical protein
MSGKTSATQWLIGLGIMPLNTLHETETFVNLCESLELHSKLSTVENITAST